MLTTYSSVTHSSSLNYKDKKESLYHTQSVPHKCIALAQQIRWHLFIKNVWFQFNFSATRSSSITNVKATL